MTTVRRAELSQLRRPCAELCLTADPPIIVTNVKIEEPTEVTLGRGRTVALYYPSSTLYQIY
jgi:hypothetical protein